MRLSKKILGILAGIMCIGALASCQTGKEAENPAIETVYMKKGNHIAKNRTEYDETPYKELASFEKLLDGIYLSFKPKYDIYIHTISIDVEGSTDNLALYSCGSSSSLTDEYGKGIGYDFMDEINLKKSNKIIIEKKYSSSDYFYFAMDDYCQYSNIQIDYSKEKNQSDTELDYFATLNNGNVNIQELESSTGCTKKYYRIGGDIIIDIRKNIDIKNISLSLLLEVKRKDWQDYATNAVPIRKISDDNLNDWYPEKRSDCYNFSYSIDSTITFSCFLSNVRNKNKSTIESLDYLNTYTEKSLTETNFDYTKAKNYTIDFNQKAKDGDYLIISFNYELVIDTTYYYNSFFGETSAKTELYFLLSEYTVSNLKISY